MFARESRFRPMCSLRLVSLSRLHEEENRSQKPVTDRCQRLLRLFATVALTASLACAQTSVVGQWTSLQQWPYIAGHSHLLPTGKLLFWPTYSLGDNPQLWDPATNSVTAVTPVGYDLFCTGHSFLPSGKLFVTGGDNGNGFGITNASIYDPASGTWTRVANMSGGRWYPTNTALANGDVLVVSGQNQTGAYNTLPEVWQLATSTWRKLTSAQLSQPLYPRMFLAPNGQVAYVEPVAVSQYLNTSGTGTWTNLATEVYGSNRDYGNAVMYDAGKILLDGGGDPATATAEVIDLNASTPSWRAVQSMRNARRQSNATLLPDGTVLVTGGSSGPGFDNASYPVYPSEIWNPSTETWTTVASITVYRGYHSTAILLPDGRVVSAGGEVGGPSYEIYSPPYLFKGARPTITSAPTSVGYGQTFFVQTPDAASISQVTWIRLTSVTHSFNQNQRLLHLSFSRVTGGLNVTSPANANLSPPGDYLLFIVNSNGVPSVGSFVNNAASGSILSSVTVNPTSVTGGSPSTGTVTLSGAAPSGGATVTLSSNNTAATVPSSVTVSAGSSSTTFPITTVAVAGNTPVTITGNYNSGIQTGTLTVLTSSGGGGGGGIARVQSCVNHSTSNLQTITCTFAANLTAGNTVLVTLGDGAARSIPIASSVLDNAPGGSSTYSALRTSVNGSTAGVELWGVLRVNGGAKQITVTTAYPSNGMTVAAAEYSGANAFLTNTYNSGTGTTMDCYLNPIANANDFVVGGIISASATVPTANTGTLIQATATSGATTNIGEAFMENTAPTATLVMIRANLGASVWAQSACVELQAGATSGTSLSSVTVNPASVTGGSPSTGTVTLSGAVPSGGATVTLSSNNTAATVPSSVTVSAGSSSATFPITTVAVAGNTPVTITGNYNSGTQTAALIVTPPALSGMNLNPASVTGGSPSTGMVTLSSAAPAGGATITLSSGDPAVATVPASVTVAAGATSATFQVSTTTVSTPTAITLAGTDSSGTRTATLTVTPATPSLSSVTVNPTSVTGGSPSTGTVTLSGAAPSGGATVTLSSNNTAATVPSSVTVSAGSSSTTFPITTVAVAGNTPVTITGNYNSGTQTATLTLTPATPSLSSVTVNPTSVTGGSPSTGTVTLSGAAPSGGATVTLSSNNTAATVPSSVTVSAGSSSTTFPITTVAVAGNTPVTITGNYNSGIQTGTLTVLTSSGGGGGGGIARVQSCVNHSTSNLQTITCTFAANLTAGNTVLVTLGDGAARSIPIASSVLDNAPGGSSTYSALRTSVNGSTAGVELWGVLRVNGGAKQITVTTAYPSNGMTVAAAEYSGANAFLTNTYNSGTGTTMDCYLNPIANANDFVVGGIISASATVPTANTGTLIQATATSGATTNIGEAFMENTAPTATLVMIRANLGASVWAQSACVELQAGATSGTSLSSVTVNPASVTGGSPSTGTVTLSGAVPSGGATVTLSSNNTAATVPSSVTVSAGSSSATFPITTVAVAGNTPVTITGNYNNGTQTATLTLTPATPSLSSVTVNPTSVTGGSPSTGTVTLSGAAPSGGATVTLSSNNTAATVPSSVTVSAGSSSATFPITTVAVAGNTPVTITGNYNSGTQTATLTLTPATPSLSSVTVNPTSVTGGSPSTGTVTLSGAAPSGGATVTLSSNNTAATVPSSVTVSAGSSSTTFPITTVAVAGNTPVTITGNYNSGTQTATLTLTPATPSLSSVTVNPTSVTGGSPSTGTVTLSGAAPSGGATVTLSSNNTAATVPSSVTVSAGSSSATFPITTVAVAGNTPVTITGNYNSGTQTATLTLTPATPSLSSVTVNPTSVTGGSPSTGTVTLSGAAPSGGATVTLSSNNTAATVPSSVTVSAGSSSTTFPITTVAVAGNTPVTITGNYNSGIQTGTLTVLTSSGGGGAAGSRACSPASIIQPPTCRPSLAPLPRT